MSEIAGPPIFNDEKWREKRRYKIAVLSDSHGFVLPVELVASRVKDSDLIIHLGDISQDGATIEETAPNVPLLQVRGNTDYLFGDLDEHMPREILIEIGEARIYCTHGHIFGRSMIEQSVCYRALELGADLALFGHTHCSLIDKQGAVTLVNPGSLSRPRDGKPASYALIEIEEGRVNARIIFF